MTDIQLATIDELVQELASRTRSMLIAWAITDEDTDPEQVVDAFTYQSGAQIRHAGLLDTLQDELDGIDAEVEFDD